MPKSVPLTLRITPQHTQRWRFSTPTFPNQPPSHSPPFAKEKRGERRREGREEKRQRRPSRDHTCVRFHHRKSNLPHSSHLAQQNVLSHKQKLRFHTSLADSDLTHRPPLYRKGAPIVDLTSHIKTSPPTTHELSKRQPHTRHLRLTRT